MSRSWAVCRGCVNRKIRNCATNWLAWSPKKRRPPCWKHPNGPRLPPATPRHQRDRSPNELLPPSELAALLANLDRIYPTGSFRLGPVEFEKASRLRAQHSAALERYRAMVAADDFRFHVALTSGLLADLSFLDQATAMHRLEAIGAAEALLVDRPGETILNLLRHVSRGRAPCRFETRRCASDGRPVTRGDAARGGSGGRTSPGQPGIAPPAPTARGRTADTSGHPMRMPGSGDRAMGLHAYEMVRDGQLLNLLTVEEIRKLAKQQEIGSFTQAVTHSLDQDELFYLQSMRSIIESCSEPYYRRQSAIAEFAANLDQLRDTPRFPLFAAQVLLVNLDRGLRLQALDRARCEAFSLAVSAAAGATVTPSPVNPLTGKPFELVSDETGGSAGDRRAGRRRVLPDSPA